MKWLALIFLTLVVAAPALSLTAAAWVPNLQGLVLFACGGLLVGYALGSIRLRPYAAHTLAIGLGFELAIGQFARVAVQGEWGERIRLLLVKLGLWAQAALQGGASNDSLMFALTLALLSWAIGYFGA